MKISEELVFVGNIPIHRKRANSEKRKSEEVKETNSDGTLPLEPPHKVSRPSEVSTSASQQISLQEVDLSSSSSSIDPVTPNTTTFSPISPIGHFPSSDQLLEARDPNLLFESCSSPISLANTEQKTIPHIFDCSFLSQPDATAYLNSQNESLPSFELCEGLQENLEFYIGSDAIQENQLVQEDVAFESFIDN